MTDTKLKQEAEEMQNIPEKIFLQIDADGETPEDFKELTGVSWCVDKINDNDLEYTHSRFAERSKKEFAIELLKQASVSSDPLFCFHKISELESTLTTIKQ